MWGTTEAASRGGIPVRRSFFQRGALLAPSLPRSRWHGGSSLSKAEYVKSRSIKQQGSIADPVVQPWCESESLLASLYSLQHHPCSELQENTSIAAFADIFSRFVEAVGNDANAAGWPNLTAKGHAVLSAAVKFAASSGDSSHVQYFPKYGCAVVAFGAPDLPAASLLDCQLEQDALQVYVVCLDDWEFRMHRWGFTSSGSTFS